MEKTQRDKLNICFVSPHPDDIELYCGGTLLAHVQNDNVSVLMMTKGGLGTANKKLKGTPMELIREKEAIARYSIIDNVKLLFAGFKDKNVMCNTESLLIINHILKELKPDIIYLPEFDAKLSERSHSDHLNTGQLLFKSRQYLPQSVKLRCYHSKAVNLFIKIDEYFDQNNAAIKFYQSQLGIERWPFMTKLTHLNYKYNKKRAHWGRKIGAIYAEGFREL